MKVLYKLIDWYTTNYSFPFRGWKYFASFLRAFKLDKLEYRKRIGPNQFLLVKPIDHLQKNIFWYGSYEKEAIDTLYLLTKESDIILDIGANIGYYSIMLGLKANKGHIYAFEPATSIRDHLLRNIKTNRLDNISVIPYVVSNETGTTQLFVSDETNIGMSGLVKPENFSGQIENVKMTSIDDWMGIVQPKTVTTIKIDVEGAEVKALQGMQETIKRFRPILLIEVIAAQLRSCHNSIDELFSYMQRNQYNCYLPTKSGLLKRIESMQEGYTLFFIPEEYKFDRAAIAIE